MASFSETELKVIRWAEDRKIIPNSTPLAQTRKTLEESGEMLEAAAQLRVLDRLVALDPTLSSHPAVFLLRDEAMKGFKDAVGDVVVTLINASALADVGVAQCLALAYEEIKDRKGTLLPSGVFVKGEATAPTP